jgi:glycosyltransferase involved in cell wall biosynthesis
MINHYALSPKSAGGIRHFSLARQLVARGHDVTIIASSFNHWSRKEEHLIPGEKYKQEIIDGVKFLWIKTAGYTNNIYRMYNMICFAISVCVGGGIRALKKPDAVLGSSPHLFGAFAGYRLAKRFNAPFILEIRDIWPQSLVDLSNISKYHPFIQVLEILENYLYMKADHIISLLPGGREYLLSKGVSKEKISWLPNGIDTSYIPKPVLPQKKPVFSLMYAGTHGVANGLDTILDSAKILQKQGGEHKIRFMFVGDGPVKLMLQKRVNDEKIQMIDFYDPVPKEQIYDVLQKADAFIMILKKSTVFCWGVSPNKLFDYMVSARPIIFSVNAPHNPVSEAQAGIVVPPDDPLALAKAIQKLVETPLKERCEMGLRGREYVVKHHNIAQLAKKFEHILLKMR